MSMIEHVLQQAGRFDAALELRPQHNTVSHVANLRNFLTHVTLSSSHRLQVVAKKFNGEEAQSHNSDLPPVGDWPGSADDQNELQIRRV